LTAVRTSVFSALGVRLAVISAALCVVSAAVRQPIEYSHKKHLALGLDCLDCHSGADVRAKAGIPSVEKCMLCHQKLATEKPEVKKVIAYAAQKHEIPWERVYGFSPEALVRFQHAPHYRAHIACATCHGDMTQATVAQRQVRHTMGSCLNCHRQKNAPEDCAACHG
jgi:class III cytochrome C family protein/cytochrome c7-like protein